MGIAESLATIKDEMRYLTIILIILSPFACHQKTDKNDTPTEKFERILGEQETTYLNEIVCDLDNYLASTYPDQESKFKTYLVDISKSRVKEYWKIESNKLKKYGETNLFGKYDTIYPDSVWYGGLSINIKYPDFEFIEEMIPIKRKNGETNIDSMINSLKIEPKYLLIEQSVFYPALDSIQESDSLIINYIDAKEAAGNMSPLILVGGLMYNLNENNEYFAKRIFVMEMYER